MTKRYNGYNWGRYSEQKLKELQEEADVESLFEASSGEEQQDGEPEGGESDGQDDGDGGGDSYEKNTSPYPGAVLGLTSPVGRMVHDKEVRDKIGTYVDYFLTHAAKDKYPVPPGGPEYGLEFIVIEDKVLVWLLPDREYTVIQFSFGTSDGIPCQVRESMENSDFEEIKRQTDVYISNQRRENMFAGHARIVH